MLKYKFHLKNGVAKARMCMAASVALSTMTLGFTSHAADIQDGILPGTAVLSMELLLSDGFEEMADGKMADVNEKPAETVKETLKKAEEKAEELRAQKEAEERQKAEQAKREALALWRKVIIGCVPIVIVGVPLDMILESYLSGEFVIATTLILYGIAFIVIESRPKRPSVQSLDDLSDKTAFLIGCFQVLAAVPGTSRSGATILGAVLLGCSRYVASEFSFFLAVPVMAGASGLKLLKYFVKVGMFSFGELGLLLIGTFVSFIVSVFAIRMLLTYIRKHDFKIFGVYRIVLGVIVLVYFGLLA